MEEKICFIQFTHPGGEHGHDKNCPNFKSWNQGIHQRKFIRAKGSIVEKGQLLANQDLVFWGEWEPASTVITLNPQNKGDFPRYLHTPKLDLDAVKGKDVQNTDPFVFADAFYYRCCKQIKSEKRTQLSYLQPGSIILFGSTINQNKPNAYFALDTVFVVAEGKEYDNNHYKNELTGFVPEKYPEIVRLGLKVSEGGVASVTSCGGVCHIVNTTAQETLRCYKGATPTNSVEGMYSFAPCKRYEDNTIGFERLKIRQQDFDSLSLPNPVITNNLNSAPKIMSLAIENNVRIWKRLRELVSEQGLLEGMDFKY